MNAHTPNGPDFGSPEEAAAYQCWLGEKVAAALTDGRPSVPHGQVMVEMKALLAEARRRKEC